MFEAGELRFFADLAHLNEAKTLSARKAGQTTKTSPHENGPAIVTLASPFLAICRLLRAR